MGCVVSTSVYILLIILKFLVQFYKLSSFLSSACDDFKKMKTVASR